MTARKLGRLLLALALVVAGGVVALVTFVIGRTSAHPPLPNPNGYDDFVRASQGIAGDVFSSPILNHDRLQALVFTNTEALRLLRLGLSRRCSVPTDSATTNVAGWQNELDGLKQLAQLLVAEARLREMEGRPGDAALSYVDAIRLGNEMSRGGFIIHRLVGCACEALGCSPLAKLAPRLSPDEARPVVAALEKIDDTSVTWEEVLRNDKSLARYQLSTSLNPLRSAMRWWRSLTVNPRARARHKAAVTRVRLLAVELALRSYLCENARVASRLEELLPNYLTRVPPDPFTGQPLVYRPQGTNWLLYSAGPDGVDDGGRLVGRGLHGEGDIFFDTSTGRFVQP